MKKALPCDNNYQGKEKCKKVFLSPDNEKAYRIWLLSCRDRPVGFGLSHIPSSSIMLFCELYDGDIEDFKKVILIDDIFVRLNRKKTPNP